MTTLQFAAGGGLPGETLTATYDAASRPYSLCTTLGGCFVASASYTALGQPLTWSLASGQMTRRATYSSPLARLSSLRVTGGAGSIRDRGYGYDAVGNVTTIWDNWLGQTLSFSYDHRDRLTHAWTSGTTTGADDQWMSYDAIGNLTSTAGVGSSYGASGNGTGAGPHPARVVGGLPYSYAITATSRRATS